MVTLVLGNGFDKCLGWKTGYSDFLNSSFFPKNNKWKKSGMYNAIVNDAIAKEDSWGGIEESLERYAMLPETAHTFEEDLEFYKNQSLINLLDEEDQTFITDFAKSIE